MRKHVFCLGFFLGIHTGMVGQSAGCYDFFCVEMKKEAESNHNRQAESSGKQVIWKEMVKERTLYSSIYMSDDGQIRAVYSKRPLNYYNENHELVPISDQMIEEGNRWIARQQPYPVAFYKEGSVSLHITGKDSIVIGRHIYIDQQKGHVYPEYEQNRAVARDVVPGIDKQWIFRENGVKYNYVIKNSITVSSSTQDLIIAEEIFLPSGYILKENTVCGRATSQGWEGDLIVLNAKGENVATFHAPFCYDANKQPGIASYRYQKRENAYRIEIVVPYTWLSDPARVFPVVIDPLVIGPTAQWTGGYIPSCIMPSMYADSIQVTIPAGVTITGFYVTSSFYADPFTGAVMSQGAMKFSTSCASSQTFTVSGPNGNLPGTAYLDSFDLRNPLTCCFSESCSPQTFYLRMHLGRTGPGTGCNSTYIRHDPFTTQWPFKAVIYGRTVESYAGQWVTSPTPLCANTCTVEATAYVRYGVAPYTFSHPWTTTVVTQGVNIGCASGATNYQFTLTIPDCPKYCDESYTSLTIPPPVIKDACNNVVSGIASITRPVKIAPNVTAIYDSVICAGDTNKIEIFSCVPQANIYWYGNNSGGTGNITDIAVNAGTEVATLTYGAYAEVNGCYSDTIALPLQIHPLPAASFAFSPDPGIIHMPVTFTDQSLTYAGSPLVWVWSFGDGDSALLPNPEHTYQQPDTYRVCLSIVTDEGCKDTSCREVAVIPAEIIAPNVITPNGDGLNDYLVFRFLEYYPDNELLIYNRWGTLIYKTQHYKNDWEGSRYSDGTYYYVLRVNTLNKVYSGFFELLH